MSVFIQIDNKTAITTDPLQWRLSYSHSTKAGVVEWTPGSFFPSLESCCKSYVDRAVRVSDARTMADLRAEIENAVQRLKTALAPMDYTLTVEGPRGEIAGEVANA